MSDNEQNLLGLYRELHDFLSDLCEGGELTYVDGEAYALLCDKLQELAELNALCRKEEDQ